MALEGKEKEYASFPVLVVEGLSFLSNHETYEEALEAQKETPGSSIREYWAYITKTDAKSGKVLKWSKQRDGFSLWV